MSFSQYAPDPAAGAPPAPWWEPETDGPAVEGPVLIDRPAPPTETVTDLTATEPSEGPVISPRPTITSDAPSAPVATVAPGGLTSRGAFVLVFGASFVGCLIGFVVSGVTTIPAAAGWGLILGSVTAALLAPSRLGWTPVWIPPLAMLAVTAVLGQVTMIGSMPTFARELAMVAANLTAMAPAQLVAVAAAGAITALKLRLLHR